MWVRGAPLIGATAAYGAALAMREDSSDNNLDKMYDYLLATRPTAVNLQWALDEMKALLINTPQDQREIKAYERAAEICNEDVEICSNIGMYGAKLIQDVYEDNKLGFIVTRRTGIKFKETYYS